MECVDVVDIHKNHTYSYMYVYVYVYISMSLSESAYIYIYTYVYIYIWVTVYPPPAFCDISKSHELRQFRANGLGYMSLRFRLRNFPISQIVLAHLGWDYLGNWEVCTCNHFPISEFPK